MDNSISVSKAAKLLGMKRSELNALLSAADIPTFEGAVDFEKVKCVSPSLDLSDPEILDRVKYIRENLAKPAAIRISGFIADIFIRHDVLPSGNSAIECSTETTLTRPPPVESCVSSIPGRLFAE